MAQFTMTEMGKQDEILAFAGDYVTMSAMMDDTGISADEKGRKIVRKGTFVGGASASVFKDRTQKLRAVTAASGSVVGASVVDGVLFDDVDVTHGPAVCAVMFAGTVKSSRLPEAISDAMRKALAPDCRLSFIAE